MCNYKIYQGNIDHQTNYSIYYQGNCTKENAFGFRDGRPCILIKLNKIFGWEPIPYQEKYLPETFPADLEKKIKSWW